MDDWHTVALFSVFGLGMVTSLDLFVRTVLSALRADGSSSQ